MSLHISPDRVVRALKPPEPTENAHQRPSTTIRLVAVVAAGTALTGVVLLTAAIVLEEWRTALIGSTLLVVSAIAGNVLVWDRLMADRQEFYRRGQLDGWMRGWRGQEPEGCDPLWKRTG